MLSDQQDAFGHMLWDAYQGKDTSEIIERDDGHIDVARGFSNYVSSYDQWPDIEKGAVEMVEGRVLDVGCGAGRHALYLQDQGCQVVGVDVSPLAIRVCRARGAADARLLSVDDISQDLGLFDAIIMMGNNWGLTGSWRRGRWLLRRFHALTSPEAQIVASTTDPYATENPEHLAYHQCNRERGRMGGQVRLRVRYKRYITPWMDYLLVSLDEMEAMVDGTGWGVTQVLEEGGPHYVAVLEKT